MHVPPASREQAAGSRGFTRHAIRTTHHAPRVPYPVWFIAVCLSLTSCIRREPPADVVIVNGTEPESLDPHVVTGIPEMRLTKALFDGLTKLDPVMARPSPALAERR